METLCYPIAANITTYLNQPHVRQTLGVDRRVAAHVPLSEPLHNRFVAAGDMMRTSSFYVAGLLERCVKVLIYVGQSGGLYLPLYLYGRRLDAYHWPWVGDYDWICNWIGNLKWTERLEWTGHDAFVAQDLRSWSVNGTHAGVTRSAKGLTYATIHAAGHMVS